MVLEDSETTLIATASMMLTSGVELLRSTTGCETCGYCWGQPAAYWMVGRRKPFPSGTTVLTSHRRIWPSGPEMVMRRQAAFCWQKLRTDRSLVFPMQRTLAEEAGHWWPIPLQESGPFATERLPGCCVILEDEQALAWCPSKISSAEKSGGAVGKIWSRLPCWCTKQPRRCRTSGALPKTWVEAGTELHSETLPPSLTDLYADLPAAETMCSVQEPSWLGTKSDLLKLITHPRCCNTCRTKSAWVLACTVDDAQMSQLSRYTWSLIPWNCRSWTTGRSNSVNSRG